MLVREGNFLDIHTNFVVFYKVFENISSGRIDLIYSRLHNLVKDEVDGTYNLNINVIELNKVRFRSFSLLMGNIQNLYYNSRCTYNLQTLGSVKLVNFNTDCDLVTDCDSIRRYITRERNLTGFTNFKIVNNLLYGSSFRSVV